MAPQAIGGPVTTLRAITFRISSTPAKQLPQVISHILEPLQECRSLLASAPAPSSKNASDGTAAVHKFKSQVTALLQDRSVEGKWVAVVLIKTILELGGWEVLHKSGPWVRGLLSILPKPCPHSLKKLAIITLSRLFTFTWEYQTLVREITTPSLPTFIQSCLSILSKSPSLLIQERDAGVDLLHTILESFSYLIPRHPTIFRSYQGQLQNILCKLVAPAPSNRIRSTGNWSMVSTVPENVSIVSRRLLIQLHYCAPKSGSPEEWEKSYKGCIASIHQAANKVFRAVVEDRRSTTGYVQPASNTQTWNENVEDLTQDGLGLEGWSGIYAGSERIVGLLALLKQYFLTPTQTAVNIRIGATMDVLTRLFSLIVPPANPGNNWINSIQLNSQVPREERDALWTVLPQIHVAAMDVAHAMLSSLGIAGMPFLSALLTQIAEVFQAEKNSPSIRIATYETIQSILDIVGPSFSKAHTNSLTTIAQACCADILQQQNASSQKDTGSEKSGAKPQANGSSNADTFLTSTTIQKKVLLDVNPAREYAQELLSSILSRVPSKHFSLTQRALFDRTAILSRDKMAMVSSILNPASGNTVGQSSVSILPILARLYPNEPEIEGILRPRMPIISVRRNGNGAIEEDDDEENTFEARDALGLEDQDHNMSDYEVTVEESEPIQTEDGNSHVAASQDEVPALAQPESPSEQSAPSDFLAAIRHRDDLQALKRAPLLSSNEPPSPKRVKLAGPLGTLKEEGGKEVPVEPQPVLPQASPLGDATKHAVLSAEEVPAQTPIEPIKISAVPRSQPEEESDSDEDFGELVLGQDTDEEED